MLYWVSGVRLVTTEGEWIDSPRDTIFPVKTVKVLSNGLVDVDDVEVTTLPCTEDIKCVVIRLGDVFVPIPEQALVLTKTKQTFQFTPTTMITTQTSLVCLAFDHALVTLTPDEVKRDVRSTHHTIQTEESILYGVRDPHYRSYGFACVVKSRKKT